MSTKHDTKEVHHLLEDIVQSAIESTKAGNRSPFRDYHGIQDFGPFPPKRVRAYLRLELLDINDRELEDEEHDLKIQENYVSDPEKQQRRIDALYANIKSIEKTLIEARVANFVVVKTYKSGDKLDHEMRPPINLEKLRKDVDALQCNTNQVNPSLDWKWCPQCAGRWASASPICESCGFDCIA